MAQDGDDLGDGGRVGGVALPLVARRATGVEARQGGRRSWATGGIENDLGHDASLGLEAPSLAQPQPQPQPQPRPAERLVARRPAWKAVAARNASLDACHSDEPVLPCLLVVAIVV